MAAGIVPLDELAHEWDEIPEIRNCIRAGGGLLDPESEKICQKTTILNKDVLAPVLGRMAASTGKAKLPPSPAVEDLREQVNELMTLSKQETDFAKVDHVAWQIRRFTAFLKVKTRKHEVSNESRLQIMMWGLVRHSTGAISKVMSQMYRTLQDPDFQKLVLTLDPFLEVSWQQIQRV